MEPSLLPLIPYRVEHLFTCVWPLEFRDLELLYCSSLLISYWVAVLPVFEALFVGSGNESSVRYICSNCLFQVAMD